MIYKPGVARGSQTWRWIEWERRLSSVLRCAFCVLTVPFSGEVERTSGFVGRESLRWCFYSLKKPPCLLLRALNHVTRLANGSSPNLLLCRMKELYGLQAAHKSSCSPEGGSLYHPEHVVVASMTPGLSIAPSCLPLVLLLGTGHPQEQEQESFFSMNAVSLQLKERYTSPPSV